MLPVRQTACAFSHWVLSGFTSWPPFNVSLVYISSAFAQTCKLAVRTSGPRSR